MKCINEVDNVDLFGDFIRYKKKQEKNVEGDLIN